MAWTTPKTWTSEPLTSTDLNAQLRDNQNYLKDRLDSSASAVISGVSNYTTAATAFADVDASKLSLTLNTHGGAVLLGFTAAVYSQSNGAKAYFNVAVDAVDYFAGDGITQLTVLGSGDNYRHKPLCLVVLIPGLSAGRHTFTLRWKTSSNGRIAIETVNLHPQFWAQEI